jgi:transcriptional regulator with XRE-family HTH domain
MPKRSAARDNPSLEAHYHRILRGNLRNRRRGLGLTQANVAEAVGVTEGYIGQLESPTLREWPNLPMLFKLATALQTSAAALLTPNKYKGEVDADDDLRKPRFR